MLCLLTTPQGDSSACKPFSAFSFPEGTGGFQEHPLRQWELGLNGPSFFALSGTNLRYVLHGLSAKLTAQKNRVALFTACIIAFLSSLPASPSRSSLESPPVKNYLNPFLTSESASGGTQTKPGPICPVASSCTVLPLTAPHTGPLYVLLFLSEKDSYPFLHPNSPFLTNSYMPFRSAGKTSTGQPFQSQSQIGFSILLSQTL